MQTNTLKKNKKKKRGAHLPLTSLSGWEAQTLHCCVQGCEYRRREESGKSSSFHCHQIVKQMDCDNAEGRRAVLQGNNNIFDIP